MVQNPQLENGYTRIANEILDELVKINLSSYQFRLLFFIIRKTYGFNKGEDWISNSQIVNGTGIRKSHVSRTKKELLKRSLIVTSSGNKIKFNKIYKLWDKLPNQVTNNSKPDVVDEKMLKVTNSGNNRVVANLGNTVTNSGNKKLPDQGHTKDKSKYNIQKKGKNLKELNLEEEKDTEVINASKEVFGVTKIVQGKYTINDVPKEFKAKVKVRIEKFVDCSGREPPGPVIQNWVRRLSEGKSINS